MASSNCKINRNKLKTNRKTAIKNIEHKKLRRKTTEYFKQKLRKLRMR